ncbi:MAG: RnfH family protein [Gammaproteobacteria bacterium]|nr:RnfH family protein [Sideroxydans sp.]MBU3904012.1 RnfH family protein [Gammaproteobacteria bacterium]MBU4046725.1 RnfH family protein [Gammaproteobacteria bacterium]MBU4151111.1 RnfH family protein [Gammaproteobacteria bacterium]
MNTENIDIELVYALPQEQALLKFKVPAGTTLGDAVRLSGILDKHPEIDPEKAKYGIFGKLSKADVVMRERDRIEIYRPLIADPKEVRRKRAEEGKVMKKGGGDA